MPGNIMSGNTYEQRKNTLLNNYKLCGHVSILFLEAALASSSGAGDSGMNGFFHRISIPLTILTPITLVAGLMGAIANTAWGSVALPLAKIQDKNENKISFASQPVTSEPKLISNQSSTKSVMELCNMNVPHQGLNKPSYPHKNPIKRTPVILPLINPTPSSVVDLEQSKCSLRK